MDTSARTFTRIVVEVVGEPVNCCFSLGSSIRHVQPCGIKYIGELVSKEY